VTFTFTDGPNLQPAGPGYPWHQQLVASWTLDITCTDGTTQHGEGQSRWFVVRGDSAQIPQELKDRGFTQDPGRWYVERWLEEQNTRPIVVVPAQLSGKVQTPISFQVSVQDPNDEPITSLTALSGLEGQFTVAPGNGSGTYVFIPINAGTYALGFEAVNSLVGTGTTIITVQPNNQPPTASLVLNPGGSGPTSVTADGSGSHDPDGRIMSYRFDFGDGTIVGPQLGPTATHVFSQGGIWPITLLVTDNAGATASVTVRDTIVGPPVASLVISPTSGPAPLTVTADASHSTGQRQIASYRFDFGDGTVIGPQSGTTASHTYVTGGIWPVTLLVTDNYGAVSSMTAMDTVIVAPVASLVMWPSTGVAPLNVTADASHSTGTGIVSYRFDFGDGTVIGPQTNSSAPHTYAAGNWTASVRITDSRGVTASASASVAATMSDPVGALQNLCKNPSFEVNSTGWESFYGSTIAIVPGGHDGNYALQMTGTTALDYGFGVNDHPDWIHPTTAAGRTYRYTAWVRSAASQGTARIRVREYLLSSGVLLGQISSPAARLTPDWQQLVVDYTSVSTGSSLDLQVKDNPLTANEVFLTDDISIKDITGVAGLTIAQGGFDPDADATNKDYDGEPLSFRSVLFPSPVQTSAVLSFATTRSGALRVDLLDVAGRAVRRLDDETDASAGMHTMTINGMRDDGRRMRPGLYFYRIVADEGQITGRFVMLK
jgi:hypothetical protein